MIKLEELNRKDFKAKDFYCSNTAELNKIDNAPKNFAVLQCLLKTADKCQEIQDKLRIIDKNFKLKITSGFRCQEVNKLVKGSPNSKHMQGLAVDVIIIDKNPEQTMDLLLKTKVKFDKMLVERGCVHVQFCLLEENNKNLVGKAKLVNGKWIVEYI